MAKAMIRFRPLGQTTLDYYSVGEKLNSDSNLNSENKNILCGHMDIITKIASNELQLIAKILDYLTLEDLIRIDFVCSTWREILEASFELEYSILVTNVGDGLYR